MLPKDKIPKVLEAGKQGMGRNDKIGLCQKEGCAHFETLYYFKGQMLCRDCLMDYENEGFYNVFQRKSIIYLAQES